MKSFYTIILTLLVIVTSFPQKNLGDGWKILGQVRLRTELDGRDFSNKTHPLTFASSRIRLGVEKSFDEKLIIFIQAQDSRVFGQESNTLANSKNLDLHQGFVKLNRLFGWNWSIQAGRFEVSYGTQRFIGAVGWHYVGRSFDGISFTIAPEIFDLDLFALTVSEPVSYIGNANPVIYLYPQEPTPASSIYGVWKKSKINDQNKIDVFGYWEINRQKVAENNYTLNMATVGGSYWGVFNNFYTVVEAGYQFGDIIGKDVSAYLVSATAFFKTGNTKLGLGADILSGTNPNETTTKMNTFQPTYATNHKFYGFMDYFINIPKNTMNLGLHDFYIVSVFNPGKSNWSFSINLHHFMSNQTATITTDSDPTPHESNMFGQEVDLTVKYEFIKGTTIVWGGSFFVPADLMKNIFKPREDVAYWTYLMIIADL